MSVVFGLSTRRVNIILAKRGEGCYSLGADWTRVRPVLRDIATISLRRFPPRRRAWQRCRQRGSRLLRTTRSCSGQSTCGDAAFAAKVVVLQQHLICAIVPAVTTTVIGSGLATAGRAREASASGIGVGQGNGRRGRAGSRQSYLCRESEYCPHNADADHKKHDRVDAEKVHDGPPSERQHLAAKTGECPILMSDHHLL